jgi:hypothetical protein
MNDLARHALELNNEAVSLLLAGEDKAAVKALAEALAVMKRLHRASSSSTESKSSTTARVCNPVLSSQDAGISTASTSQTKSIDQSVVVLHKKNVPGMHNEMGSNFIYNRAFVLDSTRPPKPQQRETDLQVYSACFFFNLALIYHRHGVNQRSVYLLTKAERIYEMAKKLVCGFSLNHRTALSVNLAATNNISQIQFDQGHFSEARQGLYYLAYLIGSAENSLDLFTEREWDGLHLNMLLLIPPGAAPAA